MSGMDRARLCVQCRTQPVDPRWRPFCSRRCQVADQARWAEGAYRVPGPDLPAPDEHPDAPDDEY
jgi:endogenous inhibitor of DNA gyrase (YacG/DUF329 family)